MARIWDKYLSEQDKAHLAIVGDPPTIGFGDRPGLLLIDNYWGVLGDGPRPLLDVVKDRPGAMGEDAWDAVGKQRQLLDLARRLDLPVIHATGMAFGNMPGWGYCTRHPELRGELRGPVPTSAQDYAIAADVAPTEREFTVTKVAPSAFWGTPLMALLNFLGLDTLIVAGEATSGCVRATVVDGTSYRFRMIVVEDGVYDRHEASHAINLFDMNQKYADVLPLEEVVAHLEAAYRALR